MKEIYLKGKNGTAFTGLVAKVDDDDYEWLKNYNWIAVKRNHTHYAIVKSNKKQIQMHRVVLGINLPTVFADHIDGNGLNNQKSNLRKATKFQNSCNKKPSTKKISKYKGVYKNKNAWVAKCNAGNIKYSKTFDSEIKAALQYNEWAKKLHGEFANLNVIN